jgi:hypothetical protein
MWEEERRRATSKVVQEMMNKEWWHELIDFEMIYEHRSETVPRKLNVAWSSLPNPKTWLSSSS